MTLNDTDVMTISPPGGSQGTPRYSTRISEDKRAEQPYIWWNERERAGSSDCTERRRFLDRLRDFLRLRPQPYFDAVRVGDCEALAGLADRGIVF